MVSQLLSFFSLMPSTSIRLEFVASSMRASVLVYHCLYRTLSAHGTMRPGLLRPQSLLCDDGVSLESCISLREMPAEASVGICTSSGVRSNLVCHSLSLLPPYTYNVDSRLLSKII